MKLSPGVSAADTDGGMVLLDERTGRYWTLNPTGRIVIRALLDGGTAADAAAELARRFPAAADRTARDVDGVLEALRQAELVIP
ncbi:lasso peptide biosynthesis PqqD family chaperone [Spirillospora sp. NPDC050679]